MLLVKGRDLWLAALIPCMSRAPCCRWPLFTGWDNMLTGEICPTCERVHKPGIDCGCKHSWKCPRCQRLHLNAVHYCGCESHQWPIPSNPESLTSNAWVEEWHRWRNGQRPTCQAAGPANSSPEFGVSTEECKASRKPYDPWLHMVLSCGNRGATEDTG